MAYFAEAMVNDSEGLALNELKVQYDLAGVTWAALVSAVAMGLTIKAKAVPMRVAKVMDA